MISVSMSFAPFEKEMTGKKLIDINVLNDILFSSVYEFQFIFYCHPCSYRRFM